MKWKLSAFLIFILLIVGGFVVFKYYPYVFSKTVQGRVIGVERVMDPSIIMSTGGKALPKEAFSFAIAVQSLTSREIYTASSEDRQWGVAVKGQCAEARLFPYPPWDLEKGNTFFGARLLKLFDCPDAPPVAPGAPGQAAEAANQAAAAKQPESGTAAQKSAEEPAPVE